MPVDRERPGRPARRRGRDARLVVLLGQADRRAGRRRRHHRRRRDRGAAQGAARLRRPGRGVALERGRGPGRGHNWRPSELSMAMVAHRLDGLDRWTARARAVTARLHEAMDGAGLWRQSAGETARPAWHKIRFGAPGWAPEEAARMERALARAGVATHRWGLVPLNRHPAFGGAGRAGPPVAQAAAAGTLCLGTEAAPPMTWNDDEVEQVCRILETIIGS
ncbi:DegT/DnrJ/EryC1/StrS family aminotransferase [Actinomadura luteofluorescens]|uniref:DegT/DnrJ/EryC1/StrS family aminotransferase n=1 Tax=Actinomadura luteofluorescens TaxID=46163 RepID=UPI0036262164